MPSEHDDHAASAADQPTTARSITWLTATTLSIVLGLAAAGIMTSAMFWIGDYYRGAQVSRDELGRQKLRELRAAAEEELQTYGWVNRSAGEVRIPIERAMQLLVEERVNKGSTPKPINDSSASGSAQ